MLIKYIVLIVLLNLSSIYSKNQVTYSLFYSDSTKTYSETLNYVKNKKIEITNKEISDSALSQIFTELLVENIIPYWVGTKWSFSGTTNKPNQGTIACGYFISTTLKHMGFNLNRYKLAQQSPINEAKSLSVGDSLMIIKGKTYLECIDEIKNKIQTEGVYFIGFDEGHVGYLYKTNKDFYIIHSNFFGIDGVAIENIWDSEAFSLFNYFYIADISTNHFLLNKWLKNEVVEIIYD